MTCRAGALSVRTTIAGRGNCVTPPVRVSDPGTSVSRQGDSGTSVVKLKPRSRVGSNACCAGLRKLSNFSLGESREDVRTCRFQFQSTSRCVRVSNGPSKADRPRVSAISPNGSHRTLAAACPLASTTLCGRLSTPPSVPAPGGAREPAFPGTLGSACSRGKPRLSDAPCDAPSSRRTWGT